MKVITKDAETRDRLYAFVGCANQAGRDSWIQAGPLVIQEKGRERRRASLRSDARCYLLGPVDLRGKEAPKRGDGPPVAWMRLSATEDHLRMHLELSSASKRRFKNRSSEEACEPFEAEFRVSGQELELVRTGGLDETR
ncbi:MAG: hypothetical protein P1V51_12085 [Deltaproteobacteria bacterium]|nr:hypothetical protein [Deltaproteobacteria bacterium]